MLKCMSALKLLFPMLFPYVFTKFCEEQARHENSYDRAWFPHAAETNLKLAGNKN